MIYSLSLEETWSSNRAIPQILPALKMSMPEKFKSLNWYIYYLKAITSKDITVSFLQSQCNRRLSWEEFCSTIGGIEQAIEVKIIGSLRDVTLETAEELSTASFRDEEFLLVELRDSSEWIVTTSSPVIIREVLTRYAVWD